MSKIVRKIAKLFGATSAYHQVAQFGSLAVGSPVYSTDPATIQALGPWSDGWFSAVLGNNSPTIEDMNAFCLVMAYQIAYLMQQGVAEYDATTAYYPGSLVNDGSGNIYNCITANTGQPLSSYSYWQLASGNIQTITVDSAVYAQCGENYIMCNTAANHIYVTLPAIAGVPLGTKFTIKNIAVVGGHTVTVRGSGTDAIDNNNVYPTDLSYPNSMTVMNKGDEWVVL